MNSNFFHSNIKTKKYLNKSKSHSKFKNKINNIPKPKIPLTKEIINKFVINNNNNNYNYNNNHNYNFNYNNNNDYNNNQCNYFYNMSISNVNNNNINNNNFNNNCFNYGKILNTSFEEENNIKPEPFPKKINFNYSINYFDQNLNFTLKKLNLENLFIVFINNYINFKDLFLLTDLDMKNLGIKEEFRNKINLFIQEFKKYGKNYNYDEIKSFFDDKNNIEKINLLCEKNNYIKNKINYGFL